MSLWNQIKGLFGENKPQTPEHKCTSEERLIRHEPLDRKENFLAYFQQWLASNTKEQMLDWLYAQYQDHCCCGQAEAAIHFMIIPSVSGFVIHFDEERWRPMDFECLFDFFKQQFKQGGYRLQLAEVKVTKKMALRKKWPATTLSLLESLACPTAIRWIKFLAILCSPYANLMDK